MQIWLPPSLKVSKNPASLHLRVGFLSPAPELQSPSRLDLHSDATGGEFSPNDEEKSKNSTSLFKLHVLHRH